MLIPGMSPISSRSGVGMSDSVIKELSVKEGDWVEKDQIVAYLDSYHGAGYCQG